MKQTKLEMAKAIHEHIKGELTETNWRGTWDLFWRALDCGLDKARNLVDSYLNEDFERIAKRLKVSELEAILAVLESKDEEVTVSEGVAVSEDKNIPNEVCNGCGCEVYDCIYQTFNGCCVKCYNRIFETNPLEVT